MSKTNNNPYTTNPNRLADVIAAIQVMSVYKFYKLNFSAWAYRIQANKNNGDYWKNIFEEHPEFFRLNAKTGSASLVWRRNYQKLYNVDDEVKISLKKYNLLSEDQQLRITRSPLTNSDISTLVNIAIDLHSSEINHKQDSRWWMSLVFGLVGIFLGAFLKS